MKKGPSMSTPQFVNGGPSRALSVGLVRQFLLSKFSSKQTTFDTLPHQISNHNVPFDHPKAITSNFTDCQLPSTMGYPLMTPFNYQGCSFAFVTNKKMVNVTEMKAWFFQSSSDPQ